jgi:hypothetical protein
MLLILWEPEYLPKIYRLGPLRISTHIVRGGPLCCPLATSDSARWAASSRRLARRSSLAALRAGLAFTLGGFEPFGHPIQGAMHRERGRRLGLDRGTLPALQKPRCGVVSWSTSVPPMAPGRGRWRAFLVRVVCLLGGASRRAHGRARWRLGETKWLPCGSRFRAGLGETGIRTRQDARLDRTNCHLCNRQGRHRPCRE